MTGQIRISFMEDLKRWLIGFRDCLSMTSRYWFGCPGGD
jgi:hypothetical protein